METSSRVKRESNFATTEKYTILLRIFVWDTGTRTSSRRCIKPDILLPTPGKFCLCHRILRMTRLENVDLYIPLEMVEGYRQTEIRRYLPVCLLKKCLLSVR